MDASAWLAGFARELGLEPPSEADTAALLSLASVAANASERLAAPISCWLLAQAGTSPEEGLALARRLAAESAASPGSSGHP